MIIYKAENLINHKVYVGKTVNTLEHRRWGHFNAARKGFKTIFYNAIRKYGEDNFKFSVLDSCESTKDLNEREKYFIKTLDSMTPNGYNMTKGGDGQSKGWDSPMKGITLKDETKEKISKTLIGRKQSCETKEKRALSLKKAYQEGRRLSWNKGLPKELSPNYGKKMSEEQKKKISLSKSGEKNHNFGKPTWNKGLTKETDSRLLKQASKISGLPSWNKGLTKDTDDRVKNYSQKVSDSLRGHIPWNKGLIVIHSKESNLKRSLTMKGKPKSKEIVQNMILAQQLRRSKEQMKEVA
jgi:group I intron endonuclease